jgi:hypothetical protein
MRECDVLLDDFDAGRIQIFPHELHVRVAWCLQRRYSYEEAFARLARGIKEIAAHAGVPGKYHETMTRAWFELVTKADALERHPELLDPTLLVRYYTSERLEAGRHDWLEPDLAPLALPAPSTDRSRA